MFARGPSDIWDPNLSSSLKIFRSPQPFDRDIFSRPILHIEKSFRPIGLSGVDVIGFCFLSKLSEFLGCPIRVSYNFASSAVSPGRTTQFYW